MISKSSVQRAAIIAFSIGLLLTFACSAEDGEPSGPSGATCRAGSTLDYETFGREFMERYCTRCHSSRVPSSERHGAPNDHNYDTLNAIRSGHAEHIDEQAAAGSLRINRAMPPDGIKPSDAERRALGEWLACGSP